MNTLIDAFKQGLAYEQNRVCVTDFQSAQAIDFATLQIHPENVFSSQACAYAAGRLKHYVNLLADWELLFSQETAEIPQEWQRRKAKIAAQALTVWQNALYCQSIGK